MRRTSPRTAKYGVRPNHSIQQAGASRFAQFLFVAHGRLAPAADAGR
jgi:hypothetical protein